MPHVEAVWVSFSTCFCCLFFFFRFTSVLGAVVFFLRRVNYDCIFRFAVLTMTIFSLCHPNHNRIFLFVALNITMAIFLLPYSS
jgi:hypothetical protein